MSAAELVAALATVVPDAGYESLEASDSDVTPTILVPRSHLLATAQALQSAPGLEFQAFSDVTAVDHPDRHPRFELVYHVVSPHRRARLRFKVRIGADESVDSVSTVWPGAGWMEREVYDLFGIVFDGHADLRRLMMPDDWEGHPLRKDYPVQLKKEASTFMPLQVSPEEFRANMERDRLNRPRSG